MPDVLLSVQISRDLLGLSDLDLNDHVNYYISSQQMLGGTVSWNRTQVSSPFLDGQITTNRTKQMVTDNLTLEVIGITPQDAMNKIAILVAAFEQDSFDLQVAFGAGFVTYQCEASDYTVNYQAERWIGARPTVTFSFPRQPNAISGVKI